MKIPALPSRLEEAAAEIGTDEVHVWAAALDPVSDRIESLESLLCADDRLRAERIRSGRDRARFVARRSILGLLLAMYTGRNREHLAFRYNIYGKPMLSGGRAGARAMEWDEPGIRFNVSHSHGKALYAFTRGREIGVDIERVRGIAEMDQLAELFFSAGECRAYRAFSGAVKEAAFFNCWTQKEAYVKGKGEGFSRSLDRFDVSLDPAEPAGLLRAEEDPAAASPWTLRRVEAFAGFAAAIAVEGPVRRLQCLRWPDRFPAFDDPQFKNHALCA